MRNSEQSAEEIIKNRKALFSKNYNTAKKVQSYHQVVILIKQKN